MKYILKAVVFLLLCANASLAHAETQVYFSPNGGSQEAVVAQINKAQKSIDIAMYSFTSREIAQALVKAKKREVKIRIVLDKGQIKEQFSKSRYLINKDIDLKFHLGPGLMHDKFAVIDNRLVLTGSFNWTVSAGKRNAENLLIITDNELADKFVKQFKFLWSQSGRGEFIKEENKDTKDHEN